jgi:hypothetical protein
MFFLIFNVLIFDILTLSHWKVVAITIKNNKNKMPNEAHQIFFKYIFYLNTSQAIKLYFQTKSVNYVKKVVNKKETVGNVTTHRIIEFVFRFFRTCNI